MDTRIVTKHEAMISIFSKPTTASIVENAKAKIAEAMGDQVIALILYDTLHESKSGPIRILVLLKTVGAQALDELSSAYEQIPGRKRLAPMVMTLEELHSSTDVFPITFLEMKYGYRVLLGEDVLADLPIQFGHLRLRCEQELKNLLLRMQNSYLTQHNKRSLRNVFRSNYYAFVRTLRAALILVGQKCPESDRAAMELSSETFGFDLELANRVQQACESRLNAIGEPLRALYVALMELVAEAASVIDRLPEHVAVLEILEDQGGE